MEERKQNCDMISLNEIANTLSSENRVKMYKAVRNIADAVASIDGDIARQNQVYVSRLSASYSFNSSISKDSVDSAKKALDEAYAKKEAWNKYFSEVLSD